MKPLAGLRILAVEQFGAGPYGSMFLADLGAEVIKIENPATGGDPARHVGPHLLGDGQSQYFQTWNMNKRSVSADLKSPADRAAFDRLVSTADAVINNLRGDQPAKLGLDYAGLKRLNPRIVCLHISAYGRDNDRRSWPGYDYLMQAEAGIMALTGEPDGPPSRVGCSMVDFMTGLTGVVGLLACIMRARQTGVGCDVDTCLFDVALHQLGYSAIWYLNEHDVSRRQARSAHLAVAPVQTFPTADGWIFIMCMTDKFWERFADAIGRRELKSDPRFCSQDLRRENRNALDGSARRRAAPASDRGVAWPAVRPAAGCAGLRDRRGTRISVRTPNGDGENRAASAAPGLPRPRQPAQDRWRAPRADRVPRSGCRQCANSRRSTGRPGFRAAGLFMKLSGCASSTLSSFLPGPYLTMTLADHGAEVIKVEQPGEGDPGRRIGLSDGPSTVFFRNLNRGKKSVVLDLKTPSERDLLLELCDTADVFVETFRPGVADRLGVGYSILGARNPGIVYCSISAFGNSGPYRHRPAHDLALAAISGVLGLTVGQDDEPAIPAVAIADHLGALQGLSAILMALLRREIDRPRRLHRYRHA